MEILFKNWLFSEYADFGFDNTNKPKGGTEIENGDHPIKPINSNLIISELVRLPDLGPNKASRKWQDTVQWGEGPGAIQIDITPLGSSKIIARRLTNDLIGEECWVCKEVIPLYDNKHQNHEIDLAHQLHEQLTKLSTQMIDSAMREYEDLERLSLSLWQKAKREHPSYCMFPVGLKKQNENYYKLVFEFRGQGVERQRNGGRAEQFNIDLLWDHKRGLLRSWGYNIDSTLSQHSWKVQPSEWNEWFSPSQDQKEIVDSIIKIFIKY